MKTEIIKRTVVTADEGMILTDGNNYGKKIYLAEGADASAYREITEEEYERVIAETEGIET